MDKKELRKRYEELDGMGKALLLEKLAFCKFADKYDFENYFRIGELRDSELLCLASFLYHQECFLMLSDMMNRYKERFIFADTSSLREFEPDDALMGRLSKIGALADVKQTEGLIEKKTYITEAEHEKCRRVADAFAELEDADVVVVDTGRYGFVKLQYYTPPVGFENDFTFTDSGEMFENLWQEWLNMQLYRIAEGTPLLEDGYDEVFKSLPEEKQNELMGRKKHFAKTAGIEIM